MRASWRFKQMECGGGVTAAAARKAAKKRIETLNWFKTRED
jgi:hypothetical protein